MTNYYDNQLNKLNYKTEVLTVKFYDYEGNSSNSFSVNEQSTPVIINMLIERSPLGEDELYKVIQKTLISWVNEEMQLNKNSDVSKEQRAIEHIESFIELLQTRLPFTTF